jgi:hypothetical protein
MIPLLLLGLQGAAVAPPNPSFEYSGVPSFDAPEGALAMRSHSATIEIGDAFADVSTVSEIRNTSGRALTVRVTLPRYRQGDDKSSAPDFGVTATINNHPLTLRQSLGSGPIVRKDSGILRRNPLETTLYLAKDATYGLRISYRVPVGRAGFDRKLRLVGYSLGEGVAIGQLAISYRTAPKVVFRLPRPSPDLGWQVGGRGAFVKRTNFTSSGELTYVTYYPGGFDDIGGG